MYADFLFCNISVNPANQIQSAVPLEKVPQRAVRLKEGMVHGVQVNLL